MVNFNKETFLQAIESKFVPNELDSTSIENCLNEYPAFNSAYLFHAVLLKNKNESDFERSLPFIAVNVNDRAVLHDIIYLQNTVEQQEVEILEIEIEETTRLKTKPKEDIQLETEEVIEEKIEPVVERIDPKEEKRIQAMQELQDELFGTKVSETEEKEINPKEKRRLEAMKKLQDELFKEKLNTTESKPPEEKTAVTETKAPQEKETVFEKSEEEIPIEKKEKNQEVPSNNKLEKKEASGIIQDLIKRQEKKVKDILDEENTFTEKTQELDFIDWLKLKNVSEKEKVTKTEKKEVTEKKEKEEVEEDLVPFERTSTIEVEMHKEVKASTDPLESFISSEIIRKKKKKKTEKKQVIVSETLAEILSLQQKYTEAIEVYELLSLKYPQKSIYFAHQIEKIKNYL